MTWRVATVAGFAAAALAVDTLTKTVWGDPGFVNSELALGVPAPHASTIVGLIVLVAVAWWARPAWAAGLIIGGALGNQIDRLAADGVRDWLHVGNIVLNVADICLAVGVLACLWSVWSWIRREWNDTTTRGGECREEEDHARSCGPGSNGWRGSAAGAGGSAAVRPLTVGGREITLPAAAASPTPSE